MLNHIGTHDIETERLIPRKFKVEDAQQMFDNWAKDPKNVEYVSWRAHKNISETNKVLNGAWNNNHSHS